MRCCLSKPLHEHPAPKAVQSPLEHAKFMLAGILSKFLMSPFKTHHFCSICLLGGDWHSVIPFPSEVDRVLGLPVIPIYPPMALEIPGRYALLILKPLVESLRHLRIRLGVPVRGPPYLPYGDPHLGGPGLLERPHERVQVGVEHVRVGDPIVLDWRGPTVKEGKLDGEIRERGVVVLEEAHDLGHEVADVGPELAGRGARRARVVDVAVLGDGGLDAVAEPALVEGLLDVLEGRECGLERTQLIVGDAEHDFNVHPFEEVDGPSIRIEQLDLINLVVSEKLGNNTRVQVLGSLGSPVHAEPLCHVAHDRQRGKKHKADP
ncbi:ribose-phosphate diphosphokinase [Striga asiatica]|uniref:Ribose-phosphate diphosphokinase n=1 Tax=Striga asiatica TaxID=4170 RepID=A0A5A7PQC2_STRAF|nr:ribose-phosphate diphosphokinase [Striga asiatica]